MELAGSFSEDSPFPLTLGGGADRMEALLRAGVGFSMALSLDSALRSIAQTARELLAAGAAAVGVMDDSGTGVRRVVTAGTGQAGPRAFGPPPSAPADSRAVLAVPITVRGKLYAYLYASEKQSGADFSDSDEALAQLLADQAGVAIDNRLTFQALRETQDDLREREQQAMLAVKQMQAVVQASLGQLAGGVGHELRNPLGVIKNSVCFLSMVVPEDERVRKHLGILEREVATCNRIVTELLDFGRVKTATRAATNLAAIARDALDRVTMPPTIALRLLLDRPVPEAMIDPLQVGQILINLLTNAVQAMPDGGTLSVETGQRQDGVFIGVRDTGAGIAPEHLARIFQPLFTTRAKGIGLGLALAKDLAELNGGRIVVHSEVGRGSCFEIVLPDVAT
jgi:signal transduction histidine kinase